MDDIASGAPVLTLTDVSPTEVRAALDDVSAAVERILLDVESSGPATEVSADVSLTDVRAASEDVASFDATVVMPLDISSSAVDLSSTDVCVTVVEMISVLASFAVVNID